MIPNYFDLIFLLIFLGTSAVARKFFMHFWATLKGHMKTAKCWEHQKYQERTRDLECKEKARW